MKILLFLITFSLSIYSQTFTISGRITDSEGNSLAGANALIEGTNFGAAADAEGFYEIRNLKPGNYVIIFSMIGFKEQRISDIQLNENLVINVILESAPVESDQVIITAGKYEQKLSELPVSAEVIPSETFSEKNIINLKEALKYVPGINMIEDQLSIRGSSGYGRGAGTRVLLAIDGIPYYTGDTGEIIWEILPVNQIERIEVIKGAASSLYGSSAIGGVINVITKKIPDNPLTFFKTHFGLWDKPAHEEWHWSDKSRFFNGQSISHSNKINDFGFAISLTRLEDMGYKQSGFFKRYIGFFKADYQINNSSSITLFGNALTHTSGNFIYWKDLNNAFVPPDADQGQRTKATRGMAGILYENILSDNFLLNFRGSFYRTDWQDETVSRNSSKTNLFRGEVQTSYFLNNQFVIVSGIEGTYSEINSNIFGKPTANTFGIYTQGEYKFSFPLSVTLGARYDYSKLDSLESFSDFSPKVGLNYSLSDHVILRASLGVGFRAPSLAEAFTSTTASGIIVKPNPNVKPETNLAFEAGINYQLNYINFDAALFQTEFYDFIEPSIDPSDGLVFFSNVTRARIQGFEIGTLLNFISNLNFDINYTYLWSQDLQTKKLMKYRPRHLLTASMNYEINNVEAGVDFRYWSRFEEIDDALKTIIPDGDERVDVYVLDLRAGYNLLSLGLPLRIFINAKNILNYSYVELIGNMAPIRNYALSLELLL